MIKKINRIVKWEYPQKMERESNPFRRFRGEIRKRICHPYQYLLCFNITKLETL
jgi:hypothetical protein